MRSPGFRWLWLSTLGVGAAQHLELTATSWLALTAGGPLAVGAALAARSLPKLLFGLTAGTIADRFDRRAILLATAVSGVSVMTAVTYFVATVGLVPWQVIAIGLANGCLQVMDIPARQALALDIAGREIAPNAVASVSLGDRLSKAAGAFAGGALIATFGTAACYLAVGVAYALAAAFVLPLRVRRADSAEWVAIPFALALREATRLVLDVPTLRTLALAAIAAEVFAYSFSSAVPVLVRDVLRSGPQALGALTGSASVGATVAVVALSLLPARVRREPLLSLSAAAFGASLIALGASTSVAMAVAIMLVVGVCNGAFDVLQYTLMQLAVPVGQRGRAMGVYLLSIGSGPLGQLEAGTLVSLGGAAWALALNGAIVIGVAVILLALAPAHRWSGRHWRTEPARHG